MTDVQDRWLSVEEICQHLGVSSDTVYRWIDRSAMPAHKIGRNTYVGWKFKRDQVDAWVEAGGAAGDAREEASVDSCLGKTMGQPTSPAEQVYGVDSYAGREHMAPLSFASASMSTLHASTRTRRTTKPSSF